MGNSIILRTAREGNMVRFVINEEYTIMGYGLHVEFLRAIRNWTAKAEPIVIAEELSLCNEVALSCPNLEAAALTEEEFLDLLNLRDHLGNYCISQEKAWEVIGVQGLRDGEVAGNWLSAMLTYKRENKEFDIYDSISHMPSGALGNILRETFERDPEKLATMIRLMNELDHNVAFGTLSLHLEMSVLKTVVRELFVRELMSPMEILQSFFWSNDAQYDDGDALAKRGAEMFSELGDAFIADFLCGQDPEMVSDCLGYLSRDNMLTYLKQFDGETVRMLLEKGCFDAKDAEEVLTQLGLQ